MGYAYKDEGIDFFTVDKSGTRVDLMVEEGRAILTLYRKEEGESVGVEERHEFNLRELRSTR